MNRSKAIASSLIALLLLCVVSETAEARCRKRCRHHRRAQPCCTQTCYSPAPMCGCEMNDYETTMYDSPPAAPDAAPMPDSSADTYDGSNQDSDQAGRSSDEAPSSDSDAGNSNIPPAPPEAPAAPSATN
jgi:hypothetical protein